MIGWLAKRLERKAIVIANRYIRNATYDNDQRVLYGEQYLESPIHARIELSNAIDILKLVIIYEMLGLLLKLQGQTE